MSLFNPTSASGLKQPYSRNKFWSKPENQFWRSPLYTEEAQERLNKLVQAWEDEVKTSYSINENIK